MDYVARLHGRTKTIVSRFVTDKNTAEGALLTIKGIENPNTLVEVLVDISQDTITVTVPKGWAVDTIRRKG